jgi:adenylate cyclase
LLKSLGKMMGRKLWKSRLPLLAGALALAGCTAAALFMPPPWREILRENSLDLVLLLDQKLVRNSTGLQGRVIVVDIDPQSIDVIGPWPWPRSTIAQLLERISAAKPAVIAIDILFAEPDSRSPAALARQLGMAADRPDISAMAETLPDGDRLLAAALTSSPVVLGFALDPMQAGSIAGAPVLARGPVMVTPAWNAPGAIGPVPMFVQAAAGLGALSLPGDADGVVRRVPMLVDVGGVLHPGLALDAVRAARGASDYLIRSSPDVLSAGDLQIPLPRDALLRLLPVDPRLRTERTLSAADVVAGSAGILGLAGAIVLLGSSAPESGGLRQTAADPLTPSVQIEADAVSQMLGGRAPEAITGAPELALILGLGLLAIAIGLLRSPLAGLALILCAASLAWIAAVALSLELDRLLDPMLPSAAAVTVFGMTSVASYAVTRRREARMRRRFEQHLAPAVVQRLVEEPDLIKLTGERREITALFTDVENFTAMTHGADPRELVAVLDAYIEGVADLVIRHGGMVDKVVGDAVHAFFNAPLDLDRHAARAVDCALAIRDWTAAYRSGPAAARLGFERTRIGVETGEAIVGDIGLRTKLDYTAHGDAVNAAARLEAANKELGSSICIGPTTAARVDPSIIRPLGKIAVRGRDDMMAVFEPWPAEMPPDLRKRYLAAFDLVEVDPARAAELFECLATDCRSDPVPAAWAKRLRLELIASERVKKLLR